MQSAFLSKYKSEDLYTLFVHSVIYTFFATLGFELVAYLNNKQLTQNQYGVLISVILISHFVIDKAKCIHRIRLYQKYGDEMNDLKTEGGRKDVLGYYVDQLLHILILVFIYMWMV